MCLEKKEAVLMWIPAFVVHLLSDLVFTIAPALSPMSFWHRFGGMGPASAKTTSGGGSRIGGG